MMILISRQPGDRLKGQLCMQGEATAENTDHFVLGALHHALVYTPPGHQAVDHDGALLTQTVGAGL